jgi:hypothetical protein
VPDPASYTPGYAFSGFQTQNPTTPLPAQQLDEELIEISEALGGQRSAIMQIRRSDGKLQNGIVTPDSLADSVKSFLGVDGVTYPFRAHVRAVATTNVSTGGEQTIDGVDLVAGDRVLLAGQTAAAQNGIWVVGNVWSRAVDLATASDFVGPVIVSVAEGTVGRNKIYTCLPAGAVTVDSTPLSFVAGLPADVIAPSGVENANLAAMPQARFKMRAAGTGEGSPIDGTAAQAQTVLEAPWTQPKPMFPFASVQTGGAGFARMDRNTYLKQALWVVENDVDDARFDGGISSYIFQSVSKTVQGTNIMGVALPLAAGATVVRSAGNVELYADNKTLCLQCDDGTIHEARTTGISGSDISFTPALPTGKTVTPDGSTRQVSWGRAGSLTATAASGANSIQCSSILGITAPGERIRVPLDNGNTHLTTVSSFSAPFTIGLTDPLPSQASAGKIAYVGPHDVDPNIIISRRAVRGVPGDILAALNFTGPSSTAQTNVDVQYAQVYVEIEESSFVTGVRGRIAFCTANPLSTVGTTGVRYYMGQGLYSVDPILGTVTGGDKGPGTINVHAAYVNNAPIPSAIGSPANGRLARWSFNGAGLQDGSIFDGAMQQRMAVGSAIDFVHREAIRCAIATTWLTVRTLTPSTVTNIFAYGRVHATVCGVTDTLGGGSTRQEWAFSIANGAPTVAIIGSASNAGAAPPQFRLNVSGNTIQIQIQSNNASNILRNALMALEVIAPDGPANVAGYTMTVG